jgi:hypothetical protein
MKTLLSCALGATLGLLASAPAADPTPVPATPAMPVPPGMPAAMPTGGPALPSSAADQAAMAAMPPAPPEFVAPPHAAAPAGPSLLDTWQAYYDNPPRHMVSAEALIWWVKGAVTPPLLQDTRPSINGFRPNGGLLIDGDDLDEQQRYGARLFYTQWFDRDCVSGWELGAFVVGDRHAFIGFSSDEFPALSRPFIANNPGFEGPLGKPVFIPGAVTGLFSAELDSEFYGAQANLRRRLGQSCNARLDGLVGFRYLNLNERITLDEETFRFALNPDFPDEAFGSRGQRFDRFATNNDFFGGQVGLNYECRTERGFAFELRAMFAAGSTHERVTVEGQTVRRLTNGQTITLPGGFLALDGANIGVRTRNSFTFAPQLTGQVSYFITPGLRVFGGYDFLYWSRVARVSEQIDITLDATRIPRFAMEGVLDPATEVRPAPLFKNNDFWAQGVSFGAELKW